jgi:AhpD family alkylhydroperoxidase
MHPEIESFNQERQQLTDQFLQDADTVVKRFFNLDTRTYEGGALSEKNKEMMGLVASLVLRCDDCIRYHLGTSHKLGISDEEMMEVFSIGLVVGGSIVIPHARRGWDYWKKLS